MNLEVFSYHGRRLFYHSNTKKLQAILNLAVIAEETLKMYKDNMHFRHSSICAEGDTKLYSVTETDLNFRQKRQVISYAYSFHSLTLTTIPELVHGRSGFSF